MTHADAIEPFRFVAGRIHITIDPRVYRLAAVQKTAYAMAARCTTIIGELSESALAVTLAFPPETPSDTALACARRFFVELNDNELREKVRDETSQIRALILASAFSRTGLFEK